MREDGGSPKETKSSHVDGSYHGTQSGNKLDAHQSFREGNSPGDDDEKQVSAHDESEPIKAPDVCTCEQVAPNGLDCQRTPVFDSSLGAIIDHQGNDKPGYGRKDKVIEALKPHGSGLADRCDHGYQKY